jgi:Polysaccharide lyase
MAHTSERRARSTFAHISAAAVVLLVCIATFAGAAEAEVSWKGNYETASFSQWNLGVQQLQGPATIVRDHVREGGYAARYEVRAKTDLALPGGDRSEALTRTGEVAGTESWWGWSTYFDSDFNPNPGSQWNIFTQWHHNGSTGQANVSFMVDTASSPWNIQINAFGGDPDQNKQVFPLADFQRNVWYDFVFHVRWAPDNTGFVEVWVNGDRVVPLTYRPTTYAGMGVYLKQGLYRGESSLTSVVYHDGMRRGTSFADVVPRAGSVSVAFVRRPNILLRHRLAVHGVTSPGAAVDVTVRGPNGTKLGSATLRAGALGRVVARVRIPGWNHQRRLKVTLRAHLSGQDRRAIRLIRVSPRELLLAKSL